MARSRGRIDDRESSWPGLSEQLQMPWSWLTEAKQPIDEDAETWLQKVGWTSSATAADALGTGTGPAQHTANQTQMAPDYLADDRTKKLNFETLQHFMHREISRRPVWDLSVLGAEREVLQAKVCSLQPASRTLSPF